MSEVLLPKAKAVNLAEFIEYSADSIVSKTLLKNDAGTVTLFAFDEGQGLSEHTAPFDALVQILEGEAEIMIDGKPVETAVGQVVLMPADVPHALKGKGKFKMLLTMLKAK